MIEEFKRVEQGSNVSAGAPVSGAKPAQTDGLAALKADAGTIALLQECAAVAGIPEDEQQEIFNFLLSADINYIETKGAMEVSGGSVQYRALQLLGVILAGANYPIKDLTSTNDIYGAIRLFKEYYDVETGNIFTSKEVQAMILRKGLEVKAQKDEAKKHPISSNKLSEAAPNDAMRVVMVQSGYYVAGIEISDKGVWIPGTQPGLSYDEIKTAARCFGGSNYSLLPSEFPFVYIIQSLETLAQNATGPERTALEHVVAMIKERAGNPMKVALTNTITREERAIIYSMLTRMYSDNEGTKAERDALGIVYRNLYVKPGLSAEDVRLLNELADNMGQNGLPALIDLGDIREIIANAPAQFVPALKVLHRLSLEIAAVADYAEKRNRSFLETMGSAFTEEFSGSFGARNERRVSTSAEQGDVQMLKCAYLKKEDPKDPLKPSLEELQRLKFELFGKDGKSGLIGQLQNDESLKVRAQIIELYSMAMKIEEERKLKGDPTYGEKQYQQVRAAFTSLRAKYPAIVEKYVSNLSSLSSEDPRVLRMEMMRERYNWLVSYFMSDEIDVYFLDVLNDKFPKLSEDKKLTLNNPYLSTPQKMTLYDALFKDGPDGTSVYSRFKVDGERWASTNIAVGEGNADQAIIMAKQALVMFISSLGMTRDEVDLGAPAGSFTANILDPSRGTLYGLTSPVLRLARVHKDIGAGSTAQLGEGTWTRDNVQMQAASRFNFNYGLAWQMLVLGSEQDAYKRGDLLLGTFGEVEGDPVAVKNMLDADKVGQIIAFMTNLYSIAAGSPDMEGIPSEQLDLKRDMYRKAESEMRMVFSKLKFKVEPTGKKGERTIDEAINAIMAMQTILAKYGISVNLEEYYMPVITEKCTPEERQIVLKGLKVLRALIGDAYLLYGAQNKALTLKENKKYEPVLEAMFGRDGEPVQYFIQTRSGGLESDVVDRSAGEHVEEFGVKYLEKAIEFNYAIPFRDIQLGWTKSTNYFGDAISLGLDGESELAWEAFKMGGESLGYTYVSFFMWEYIPFYQWSETYGAYGRKDWGDMWASTAITIPFSIHSLHRFGILVGDPLQAGLGLKVVNWDIYIQQQGMTMQAIMRPVRAMYKWRHPELGNNEFVTNLMMQKEVTRTERFARWFLKKDAKTGEMGLNWLGRQRANLLGAKEGAANTFGSFGRQVSYDLEAAIGGRTSSALKKATEGIVYINEEFIAPRAFNKGRDMFLHGLGRVFGGRSASPETVSAVTQMFRETLSAQMQTSFNSVEGQVLKRYLGGSMEEIGFAAKKAGVQEVSTFQEGFAAKAGKMQKSAQKAYSEFLKGRVNDLVTSTKSNIAVKFATNQINYELSMDSIVAKVAKMAEKKFPGIALDTPEVQTFIREQVELAIQNNKDMQQFMQHSVKEASKVKVADVELAKQSAVADVKAKGLEVKTQVKVEERLARERQLVAAKQKSKKGAKASSKAKAKGGDSVGAAKASDPSLQPPAEAGNATKAEAVKPPKASRPLINADDIKAAEKVYAHLQAKAPEILKAIESGRPLTAVEQSTLITELGRVDVRELKSFMKVLSSNGKSFTVAGKSLAALRIVGTVVGPLLITMGVAFSVYEYFPELAYGSLEEKAQADTKVVRDSTVGILTGAASLFWGLECGIINKFQGQGFVEGFKVGFNETQAEYAETVSTIGDITGITKGSNTVFYGLEYAYEHTFGDAFGQMANTIGILTADGSLKSKWATLTREKYNLNAFASFLSPVGVVWSLGHAIYTDKK